ncbi:protein arginine N-methyltransferase 9-like [Vanessa atalanta]|uniref:protein arginine N-methyltransferase 9-like n=1 Tax=Vanessa atalanta TaxID=42275 RepID=UPI001FCD2556|nr:protein arginine N-methyltransferase 9-like [Vanessa atalanta]
MATIGSDLVNYARQLSAKGNYSQALDLYYKAFEKNQQLKQFLEIEFCTVITKYNELLADANRIEYILASFSRAMLYFPDNIFLINDIGRYLFRFGLYEEALIQFQKALTVDSGDVNAEKNINTVKNILIERWHFRMLNDKIRNASYRAAINKMVVPNKTRVFDLGTGTGLLAMYATEGKPWAITACDSSKVMTSLAMNILEENKLRMAVMVLNKMSTLMDSSDFGYHKCSLLITELFDAGLFGEHILQSLSHAWENLLLGDANIVPQKAEFFIMGVDSEFLNSKYQLCQITKSILNICHLHVHIIADDETYDCDDVQLYKDIKYMTEPQSVIKVDFTDKNDINEKLYSTKPYVVENKVLKNGQINSYIGWFNLYLTENIIITTDPRDKNRAKAWQQAVFFDSVPRKVQLNDTFTIDFFLKSEKLTMKERDHAFEIMRVSPETVRFLNDTVYLKMIKSCVVMTCISLGQMTELSEVNIIDLNPFPLYGFYMLQRGIKSLVCYAKTHHDKVFIETVFGANHMDMRKVSILVGETWSQRTFGNKKFHVIFVNSLDLCGDIDYQFKEIGQYLKKTHLIEGGLFMPSTITLMGQIVSSDWLDIINRVYDQNLGYKASEHINKFQVSQNFNLDYTHLEYTPLTDPIEIGDCNQLTPDVLNLPVINDGDANAILCWYKIELMEGLIEISTQRPYSFIDGTAYLANPIIPMTRGDIANILCCVDRDGLFKLIIDVENT